MEVAEKKKLKVPKLRFREFDGDWKTVFLSDISSKIGSGKTPRGGREVYTHSGVIFIRSQNVTDGRLVLNDVAFIDDRTHREMKGSAVQAGDILLNITGASIGRTCVVPNEFDTGNVNQHVCIIRLKSGYSAKFYECFISSFRGQKLIEQEQAGGGREGLNFESIKAFKVASPTLLEQQKIASFLSAVDERLGHLARKKQLLEQYKKGVMQQLFSQQLRFKREDGSDYEDWEEKMLGEICGNIGYGMNAAAKAFDGRNQYLRITDIDENSRMFDKSSVTSPEGELTDNYLLKEGDLLFARTGASVGKSYLYNPKDGIVYFAGFLIRFRVKKANALFVYYQTRSYKYDKWVRVMSMRSGQPGINAEEYKLFKMKLPCLEEQQKIADFLSSLDEKIDAVGIQMALTQQFKKGLLQEMFV